MNKIVNRPVNRLFAFGCSFTGYKWPTWPHVIAYDLSIKFYNYGRGGAGNQYIFNTLMQADSFYHFTENDLVIVEWTNFAREDRFASKSWICPGNIYSQDVYNEDWIRKWADIDGYAIRDLATIKASYEFLINKKCQFHFLKMIDFNFLDQWNQTQFILGDTFQRSIKLYDPYLNKIKPSFYEVLWQNNLEIKFKKERETFGLKYKDGHPNPIEHLEYLENVFPSHIFSDQTKQKVFACNEKLTEILKQEMKKGIVRSWTLDLSEIYFNFEESALSIY